MLNRPKYDPRELAEGVFVPYRINSFSPEVLEQYDPSPGTILVSGAGFTPQCVITLDGVELTTTYLGSTQLSATIPASTTDTLGDHPLRVKGPLGRTPHVDLVVALSTPVITNVAPNPVDAGLNNETFTISGDYFGATSVARIDGSDITTSFVDRYTLDCQIPLALNTVIGTRQVTVFNAPPGGGESNEYPLDFHYPTPVVTAFDPTFVAFGAGSQTLIVEGAGFFPTTTWTRNGSPLTVTYISPTAVSFWQPDTIGSYTIVPTNPAPGGGLGTGATIEVQYAVPTLVSLDVQGDGPVAPYGGQNSVLTCTGTGFATGSVIKIDGTSVSTTVVNATTLTCTIPASVTAAPGSHSITVFNPTPGGGTSNALTLTVSVIPYTITDLKYWLDPTRYADGVGADYTMVASMTRPLSPLGTSPPTLTITGTPSFTPLNLRVEITTGGTLGVAVFKWSSNNGDTYTTGVTTGAAVALTGTGLTLGFAAGSYSVGHQWESDNRVNGSPSRESSSNVIDSTKTLTQAVAGRRPGFVRKHPDFGNRPVIRCGGIPADTVIYDTGIWTNSVPAPATVFLVGYIPGTTGSGNFIMMIDTSTGAQVSAGVAGPTAGTNPDRAYFSWGNQAIPTTNAPASTFFKTVPGIMVAVVNGTSSVLYAGGITYANTLGGTNWSQTLTRLRLFNNAGGTVNTQHQCMGEEIIYGRVLTTNEINTVARYLASKFTLTWAT